MDRDTERCFVIAMFIVLLSHEVQARSGVWKIATRFDSKKSQSILSWDFSTTEAAIPFIIRKGKDDIVSSLLTSTATPNYKYQVLETQTTRGINITLTVYNITRLDSGVYRCSLDQLDAHKDIHINITDLMPTSNRVISTLHQDAKLIWEYNNLRYPANKLIFSRENKKIAEWTSNGGFSYEEYQYRRKLIFNKTIKGGQIDVITLLIKDTSIADFNKTYYCNLFSAGRNMLTSELKLVVEIPVWVDPSSKATSVLGEDVTFTWQYKYSFQPSFIIFRRKHEISARVIEPIGKWYDTEFVTYQKYKGRTRMKKLAAEEGEIIQLSLLNTLKDLFGSTIECEIAFQDGQTFASEITLMGDTYLTGITTEFTDTDLTAITADFTDTDLTAITTYHPVIMRTISTVGVDKSVLIHSNYHVILIPMAILFIILLFYLITRFFIHWRKHTPTYYQHLEGYVPNVENSYTAIRPPSTVSSIDTHLYESCEENVSSNVDNGTLISSSCTSNSSDYEYPMENTIEDDINPRRAAILRLHNHSASDRCEISFIDDNENLRCSSVSDEYEYPTENKNQRHFGRFEHCDTSLYMGSLKSPIISSHESGILLDKHMETGSSDSISSSELFEYPPSKQSETGKQSESMVKYYDTKLTSSHRQESEL